MTPSVHEESELRGREGCNYVPVLFSGPLNLKKYRCTIIVHTPSKQNVNSDSSSIRGEDIHEDERVHIDRLDKYPRIVDGHGVVERGQ